ncbi:sporulation membrane protein YtrI [Salibacterium aidingense]|uniref:sporulation membrane protein YtrI n=1 Tax=Salibacterium aidingense TaxID=384933 RepID=UPI0004138BD4|nr:sporulation membrane protein YtrI [Salibacterium aidingense]
MRIPPYYRRPGWQRFFAGVVIGGLVGWAFFLFQFGDVHEELVIEINKQRLQIEEQEEQIEVLRSEERKRNEENEQKLTIQEIDLQFTNEEKAKLNELALYELKQQAEGEVKFLNGKNIESVVEGKDLIKKAVENKVYDVGDKEYRLDIVEMHIYSTLELHMKIVQPEVPES